MRVNKLQLYGAWFALASTALLLLAIADVVIVALAGGFNNIASFGPAPAWVGPPMVAASAMFDLSVLTAFVVAVDLAWILLQSRKAMVFAALASVILATSALILPVAWLSVLGSNGLGIATIVVVGGYGTYLILINLAGVRSGVLGATLPWLGVVSGSFFLIAAVFGIYGWAMVFPAIALYMAWSAWLGLRLRRRAPA